MAYLGADGLDALWGDIVELVGEGVEVDAALDAASANPVRNSAVAAALGLKAPLDSPALTGAPTAPTQAAGDSSAKLATTGFVQREMSANAYSLPTMSGTVKGGAKVGEGLLVDGDALSLDRSALALSASASGRSVTCAGAASAPLLSLSVEGACEQDGTPTPEDPKEVRCVRGRNLLDKTGITDGSFFDSSGSFVSSSTYSYTDYIQVQAGEDYAASGMGLTSGAYAVWYDCDKKKLSASVESHYSFMLTAPADAAYVRLSLRDLSLYPNPQLERGSTPTPYVPYGSIGVAVQRASVYKRGYAKNETGSELANANFDLWHSHVSPGEVVEVSYISTGTINIVRIHGHDSDGAFVKELKAINADINVTAGRKTASVSIPDNVYELRLSIVSAYTDIQIVAVTPIPTSLYSLPDGTRDELRVDAAGHAVVVKRCGVVEFDGSSDEGWEVTSAGACYAIATPKTPIKQYLSENQLMCTNLTVRDKGIAIAAMPDNSVKSNDATYIKLTAGAAPSLADFKAWLAANPVTVVYPLATPQAVDLGYVDMPESSDGCTVEVLAEVTPNMSAEWWGAPAQAAADSQEARASALGSAVAGLATIHAEDALRAMAQANGYYGGRDLAVLLGASGDGLYAALHARASAANFSGLAVGDYMDVPCGIYGTRRFVIADFDPYYQCGDTAMGHHVCFVDSTPVSMPSSDSYTINGSYIYWNTTATNQGTSAEASPYMASNLHAWEANNFLPAFPSALQGYMLNRRSLCETRYSASAALTASTGWAWKSIGKIWSLSEVEVYGCVAWGTPGWTIGESRHLEYFRASKHQLNGSRIDWWLRSVSGSSSSYVCDINNYGNATTTSATSTWVRPRCGFLLG